VAEDDRNVKVANMAILVGSDGSCIFAECLAAIEETKTAKVSLVILVPIQKIQNLTQLVIEISNGVQVVIHILVR